KIARPVATIMRLPSSALSVCNPRAFSRSCRKSRILSSRVKWCETHGPTGVSKQVRNVHGCAFVAHALLRNASTQVSTLGSIRQCRPTYTGHVKRRVQSALTIFAAFTAVGLLFFGYRYLEYVANREKVSPWEPFINEVLTGAWMAALLF